MFKNRYFNLFMPIPFISIFFSSNLFATTLEELTDEVRQLAAENRELRKKIDNLDAVDTQTVRINHINSYEMLDPTTKINSKQLIILEKKQSGAIATDSVYLGGAVTAIADYQKSNTDSKFGYLMRHPTANNQRTKTVSEALVHSAQLSLIGNLGYWVNGYFEALYDPEQSFGSGTNTSLDRNQIQMRKAYILFGNFKYSPYYASVGKMATPFGLTDTPNPFTASTVWHAFGGLAYGLTAGYSKDRLNLRAMAVQGGAQFRSNNTSVDGSNVPSKLNNYVVDANYKFNFGDEGRTALMGVSYQRGSTYCQDFPVTHFDSCTDNNAAYDVYAQLHLVKWMFQLEFARTIDEWPGTFNPTIPEYKASKVTSWDVGGKYAATMFGNNVDISLDFSRFVAGPEGAPWEKQDQVVLGVASFYTPSTKLFGEAIHTDGYAPLNFISGGNLGPSVTHSDRNVSSNILLFGANVAF